MAALRYRVRVWCVCMCVTDEVEVAGVEVVGVEVADGTTRVQMPPPCAAARMEAKAA